MTLIAKRHSALQLLRAGQSVTVVATALESREC